MDRMQASLAQTYYLTCGHAAVRTRSGWSGRLPSRIGASAIVLARPAKVRS